MKQFKHINQVLGVERLESIDRTASLHIDQIELLNNALEGPNAKSHPKLAATQAETSKIKGETARIKDETTLFEAALDSINPLVKVQKTVERKVEAVRALLAAKPGEKLSNNLEIDNASMEEQLVRRDIQGIDWATIDKLEHNIKADSLNGRTKIVSY
ncbi:MAG: hypothetical protein JXR65_13070 [Bacteroidales bacterium]|nr:hypothetical protein [Bacteroidales bacterium]